MSIDKTLTKHEALMARVLAAEPLSEEQRALATDLRWRTNEFLDELESDEDKHSTVTIRLARLHAKAAEVLAASLDRIAEIQAKAATSLEEDEKKPRVR
ncbi:MAG: hypothetical protein ACHREM_00575 [Polyangiales bacterium]